MNQHTMPAAGSSNLPTNTEDVGGSETGAPEGTVLSHLSGPGAVLRQVLAAHAVRRCPHIIEVGGAGLPMTNFVTHRPASVTVIDPKLPDWSASELSGYPCTVRHIAAKLQEIELRPPAEYALVLLGLSMKPFGSEAAVCPTLLRLAAEARVLVIDYALALDRALGQIEILRATRLQPPVIDVTMKISDPELCLTGFDRRHFLAFGNV